LTRNIFVTTLNYMKKKRGAPTKPPAKAKGELVQIRLTADEKAAFVQAADLEGSALSQWIRNRLRRVSREELEAQGQPVQFLIGKGESN
jgi:hypothetical protein